MKDSLTKELNKITLLAKYATKAIEKAGLAALSDPSLTICSDVLMCTKFYFDLSTYDDWPCLDYPSTCKSIFKRINGVNEYITLIDHKNYDSNFLYFDCREDINKDSAIVEFKILLRKAIKDPSKFYKIN